MGVVVSSVVLPLSSSTVLVPSLSVRLALLPVTQIAPPPEPEEVVVLVLPENVPPVNVTCALSRA